MKATENTRLKERAHFLLLGNKGLDMESKSVTVQGIRCKISYKDILYNKQNVGNIL